MSYFRLTGYLLICGALLSASCTEESNGQFQCKNFGETTDCTCANGGEGVRTCDANLKLGSCYCQTAPLPDTTLDETSNDAGAAEDIAAEDIPDTTGGGPPPINCEPGKRKCESETVALECNSSGDDYIKHECATGKACAAGYCQPKICQPDTPLGECKSEKAAAICDSTGTKVVAQYCTADKPTCVKGVCTNMKCIPGEKQCKGTGGVEICNDDGTKWLVHKMCEGGNVCLDAQCQTACDVNVKLNTYTGCEYWAVDLDNAEGGKFYNVAVVISNPSETEPAAITITNMAKAKDLKLENNEIPPLGQDVVLLPKGLDVEGTVKTNKTFRLKSSTPVTVHQFNPLVANLVYSNDASLLLPSNVAGQQYLIHSWPQRAADKLIPEPFRGFVSIIAVEQGVTKVKITSPVDILAGDNLPKLSANQTVEYELNYGEVLNLESGGDASGPDISGLHVDSDRRVSVFSGHACANVPLIVESGKFNGIDYCDHIESQAYPLDTWGQKYVAQAFEQRSPQQTDVWRIMAGANGVEVMTDPPQAKANGVTLNLGEYVEFESADDFLVVGTGPVSVGHYLKGSNYPGFTPVAECSPGTAKTGIGDPAFTVTPPTEQLRESYIVLTPDSYLKNYLNISYPKDSEISLDGKVLVLSDKPVGMSGWMVDTVAVEPGVHRLESTAGVKFGVTAYGYACNVSYAYPGGLNLTPKSQEIK